MIGEVETFEKLGQLMSDVKRYLVMVDKKHREKLLEMAERLQSVGCQVERTMDKLGIVAVSIEANKINQLNKVEGVAEITSGEEEFHAYSK